MRPALARILIGAAAGAGATLAIASVLKRFGRGDASVTSRLSPADIARGAAAGALLGLLDARPGRIGGAITGGGVWLASEFTTPEFAIRPARGDAHGAVLLAAHLAWGWVAAEAMRELNENLGL